MVGAGVVRGWVHCGAACEGVAGCEVVGSVVSLALRLRLLVACSCSGELRDAEQLMALICWRWGPGRVVDARSE